MTNLFTPLARSVAIASLTGAALMIGSFGPASAQTPPTNKPPAAAAATSSKPETVEQRITQLKTALKITPDQESKWNTVARRCGRTQPPWRSWCQTSGPSSGQHDGGRRPQDLQEFTKARLDGLKNLTSSFKSLYNSMPADQKKNADQVFRSYGRPTPPHRANASQGNQEVNHD